MHPRRLLSSLLIAAAALTTSPLLGCGEDDTAPAAPVAPGNNAANNTTGSNNSTPGSNNATTGSNNATAGSNNSTGGSNNSTGGSNNATAGNNTTGNNTTGNNPIVGFCDPFLQDCGEDEQCTPIDGVPTCVALNRFQLPDGELCQGGDCAPGLHCVDWGGQVGQRCATMCDREGAAACPEAQQCSAWIRNNPAIGLCQASPPSCDIYAQDCPDPAQACTFGRDPDTDDPIFVCTAAGTQGDGAPCSGDNGRCMAGLVCIRDTEDASSCHTLCQADDADCPGGKTCSGVSSTWGVTFCR